jgi:hypothetical protein
MARLRLDVDPAGVAAATARIYEMVAARRSEPIWPEDMRATTRSEYRYWLAREERDYRLAVAAEMVRRGSPEAAVHYLRFYAYALARIPLVRARAAEGRNVSFLRPEQAVLPDLTRHCPEIIGDLTFVFSGATPATDVDVHEALATLSAFRDRTVATLRASQLELPALGPWKPLERVTQ